jgi:DNA-3-methyladenine glycosylase II
VARAILGRLTARFGGRFPAPAELTATPAADLRVWDFLVRRWQRCMTWRRTVDGRLPPDVELAAMEDEAVIERCVAVRGIGRWTVQMVLMFQLGRHDVMPIDDFGVRNGFRLAYGLKAMPRPKALLKYSERWKPYRSAGAWYMWRAVDLHQQGLLPKREGRAPRVEQEKPKAAKKPAKAKKPAARKTVRAVKAAPRRASPRPRRTAAKKR